MKDTNKAIATCEPIDEVCIKPKNRFCLKINGVYSCDDIYDMLHSLQIDHMYEVDICVTNADAQ